MVKEDGTTDDWPYPPGQADVGVSAVSSKSVSEWLPYAWDIGSKYARSLYLGSSRRQMFSDVETYCTFVGYPRSGHSLVAWLLDAHREVVIAPELDALKYVRARFGERQIYALLLDRAHEHQKQRREDGGRRYSYDVSGQWQGRFDRLRVIGDKKGGGSSMRLGQHPWLYDRLRATISARLVFVHVVRNPFDNISTLARRNEQSLEESAQRYFFMAEAVAALQSRVPDENWLEIRHEDMVEDAAEVLNRLCRFMDLEAPDDYVRSCTSIVRPSAHKSRHEAGWSGSLIQEVTARSSGYTFLRDYTYRDGFE